MVRDSSPDGGPLVGPPRTSVLGADGVVTSSSPLISAAGLRVLADGGNAVDATLAMAAVAWMVLPGQCGIGGDAFAIVREPTGAVWTVNGSGYGPDGGTPDFYAAQGLSALPMSGPLAVAVPGAPAALRALATAATRTLPELWAPAIELARRGIPATAKIRSDIAEQELSLAVDECAADVFLARSGPPEVGDRLRQPQLADTLAWLADNLSDFYTGTFADRAVAHLREIGAPFTGDEWALGVDAQSERAISQPYGDAVIHQTPIPSAGWMVLQQAGICDGMLTQSEQLSDDAVDWLARAANQAFLDRFQTCGSDTDAWERTLTPDALALARRIISTRALTVTAPARIAGDTTSTVCVDRDGRVVSFIHSLGFTFGARVTIPGTGILLNNRLGRGAYLIPGHPNEVRPRRKPLHTLNAWIVDHPTRGLLHAGNCPGGDGQVQWNMQVISHLVDHDDDPQAAVARPRFTVFPGSDADTVGQPRVLRVENGVPSATVDGLRARGHAVVQTPVQVGGPGGSALAISVDHRHGCVRAGADPRMEGVALAV